MITNPEFKLNYMGSAQIDPRVCAQLKDILLEAAMAIQTEKEMEIQADEPNRRKGE